MQSVLSHQKERVFLCPIVPEKVLMRHSLSIAANNFSDILIGGNVFTKVYSYSLPAIDNLDNMYFDTPSIQSIVSGRLRSNKFFRRIAFLFENIKLFTYIKNGSSVWMYNLPYTIMLVFWLLHIFKPSVSVNLILLDYTPYKRGLRSLYSKFELFCFKKCDGIITLANVDELKGKNTKCMAGVTPFPPHNYPQLNDISFDFLLSGTLSDNISMLSKVLSAFAKLPNMRLHITGKAKIEEVALIESYTSRYDNIRYHGLIDAEKYFRLLHSVTFCLSTRNPESAENCYNFPSKIIESLLHNRIVISTIEYPQLQGIKYLKIASDSSNMLLDLKRLYKSPSDQIMNYANQGAIVSETFSNVRWKELITQIEENILK